MQNHEKQMKQQTQMTENETITTQKNTQRKQKLITNMGAQMKLY